MLNSSGERIHNAVKVFFILNAIVSAGNILYAFVDAGYTFPYWSSMEKYGVSTGDYVYGIFFNNSAINATVNAIGSIYFMYKKDWKLMLISTAIIVLCTSNLTLMLFVMVLVGVILLVNRPGVRKNALVVLLTCLIAYPVLSPNNLEYINKVYEKESKQDVTIGKEKVRKYTKTQTLAGTEDAILLDNRSFKITNVKDMQASQRFYANEFVYDAPVFSRIVFNQHIDFYRMTINSANRIYIPEEFKYFRKAAEQNLDNTSTIALDPNVVRKGFERWYGKPVDKTPLATYYKPGKLYSFYQTGFYLWSNWQHLVYGAGMGNFSSKLALKMTGLGLQGEYSEGRNYASADFLQYHFYTLMFFLSQSAGEHSVLNSTNSTINQLAGEYGLLGLLAFALFYMGYIWKERRKMTYGYYLTGLMLAFLACEYWYETISLTVIFELLLYNNILYREHE